MSTTTEILFNSPALHSLQRPQLVQLCKFHSLKASGKNVDLISRLKEHAQALPKDSPLSIAARSEDVHDDQSSKENVRTGSVSSKQSEFGTASSKPLSSIKAFASSFGLKRSTSSKSVLSFSSSVQQLQATDELSEFSLPYASMAPAEAPQTDNFTFDPTPSLLKKFDFNDTTDTAPLPGHSLRPGMPAPADARMSLGLTPATPRGKSSSGPTTTLRLVSNPGLPAESATPQLKPFETTFDIIMNSPPPAQTEVFSQTPKPASSSQALPDMFIFGSPDPKHRVSDVQFRSTAASVLEEANKRLKESGVQGIGANIIDTLHLGTKPLTSPDGRHIRALPRRSIKDPHGIKSKFDKAHKEEFSKMQSIDSRSQFLPSSSKGVKRKSNMLGDDKGNPRRPTSSALIMKSAAETHVISNGRRKAAKIPGVFDDDDDADEEREGKRPRVDFEGTGKNGKDKEFQEREHLRRKLESKARRKSSAGRVSMGRNVLHKPKPPAKPSRFGFLSSAAKSIVRGVWGSRNAAAPTAPEPQRSSIKPNLTPVMPPPSALPRRKISTNTTMSSLRPPSSTVTSTSSSRSRSPIPSFTTASIRTAGTTTSRNSVVVNSTVNTRLSSQSSRKLSQTSSRLLAPTASSLAKTTVRPLGVHAAERKSSSTSTMLESTCSAPSDLPPVRQRTVSRKPRISRSKIIAKLASQRAAAASTPHRSSGLHSGRVRSSLGAKAHRKSIATGLKRDSIIIVAAKKKARQSEYARRKSRAAGRPDQTE